MELARASTPLPQPASTPMSPLTISIPPGTPAPVGVSAPALDPAVTTEKMNEPEVTLQQLEYDEDGEDTPPIEHYTYTYQDPNKVAVQTHVFEPESPSPILSAWPPAQLNPDYLAPYHPSLHKNVHNWSQILLNQVRQKGVTPLAADGTSEHMGDAAQEGETAEPGASFKGVSVATTASSVKNDAIKVEKHFLFQTHHRQPHGKHSPHSSKPHPIRPRHQIHPRRASDRSTRTFRSLVQFLQRLLRALRRRNPSPIEEENAKPKEANTSSSTPQSPRPPQSSPTVESSSAEPSDGSLQYLAVSEYDAGDQESSRSNTCFTQGSEPVPQSSPVSKDPLEPKKTTTNTTTSAMSHGLQAIKGVPKMMKFIDKIKTHANNHHTEEAKNRTSQQQAEAQGLKANAAPTTPRMSPAALAAAAQLEAAAEQKRKERARGPRMHPKLLELYEVTDRVLGVGTFATVKEIKLKSTGQSFALKIILKKTLQGKGSMLDTEIAVLSKVRHPNCVSLLEMFETEDAVYLVTDLAAGGELFDQLLKKGFYTE
ncbi:Calcium/calmodulin-dependent protein kinase type 1D, partial [Mortierella alpina]